jgi:hypothetical protein
MRSGTAVKWLAVVAAAVGVASPVGAQAQSSGRWALVSESSDGTEYADQLHARAAALFDQPTRYREAAALLVEAARVRSMRDAFSVQELITAGRLYAYAGEPGLGREALEGAAVRALGNGQIVEAAHALVDASFLAREEGEPDSVRRLVSRARRLAATEYLDPKVRAGILNRIRSDASATSR